MAATTQRTLFSEEGKGELAKERLREAHKGYGGLRIRISDSPMPEGIRGARRMRRRLTRRTLEGRGAAVLRAKEIALSELESTVAIEKEDAMRIALEKIGKIENAEKKLSKGAGAMSVFGGILGAMGGTISGGVYLILTELPQTAASVLLGSTIAIGVIVGAFIGAIVGSENRREALAVAEADHKGRADEIYKQWTKTLVGLGRKAQALVDECQKLLS